MISGRAILGAVEGGAVAKKTPKTKKPRVGRPPKDPSEKVVRIFAYVAPDVAAQLEELARAEGDSTPAAYAARKLTQLARESTLPGLRSNRE